MPNSYKEYDTPGTGANGLGQTTFSVPFKFININDINALGFDGTTWTPLTITEPRGTTSVTLSATPTSGSYNKVRLYRATSSDQLVDFQAGARLSESDLDTAYQQGLFASQEVLEDASTSQFDAVRSASITSGTTLSNFASQAFTATSNQTEFNLTNFTPQTSAAEAFVVSIDGAIQSPTDAYTVSMSPAKITLTSAAPTGSKVVVVTAASAASATAVDDSSIEVVTATNKIQVKDSGIDLTSKVTGVLPTANGGTGTTDASYYRPKTVTPVQLAGATALSQTTTSTSDVDYAYNLSDFRSNDSDFNSGAGGATKGYQKIISIQVRINVASDGGFNGVGILGHSAFGNRHLLVTDHNNSVTTTPSGDGLNMTIYQFFDIPINASDTTITFRHEKEDENQVFHEIVGFTILPNLPTS